MADRFVIVLLHCDRSDIQGVWGPYEGHAQVEAGMAALQSRPVDGVWEARKLLPPVGGGSRG